MHSNAIQIRAMIASTFKNSRVGFVVLRAVTRGATICSFGSESKRTRETMLVSAMSYQMSVR